MGHPGIPFAALANDADGNSYYQRLTASHLPSALALYDVVFSLAGKPPAGVEYPVLEFTRTVVFGEDFGASRGRCLTKPSAEAVYTVNRNGSRAGTISIGTDGGFAFSSAGVTYTPGDWMSIVTPSPQDATLAGVTITLEGTTN